MENENKNLNKFQEYSVYFFTFAVIGWIMETFFSLIVLGHFAERGFLYGPLCPIYGYSALIMIIFLSKHKKKPLKLFFYSLIVFTIFEYFTSYILEALFNMHFWDYKNDFFNINGRIAIFYSLAWGFIALIFNSFIYPFIKKILTKLTDKIPYNAYSKFLYIIYGIYLIDTVLSCIRYLH